MKLKQILKITTILIVSTTLMFKIYNQLYFYLYLKPVLQKRALVIVAENDNNTEDFGTFYKDTKPLSTYVLAWILNARISDIKNLSLAQIIDIYGEDYYINLLVKAAPGYGKYIRLSDEQSNFDNFKSNLIDLSNEGFIVDVVIDVHSNSSSTSFGEDSIDDEKLLADLQHENLKLGFVYQTVCLGGSKVPEWTDIGAKSVSGSVGYNDLVII